MSTDLTAPTARVQRDALADRADVLDRVGALMLLPGDAFATTDLVAGYYGVDRKTVEKLVERNLDEVASDGFRVVRGSELTDIVSVSALDRRISALAVFPKRAILRVGMLLRDSSVARKVRDALLDAERADRPSVDVAAIDRTMLARWVIEAEERAKAAEAHLEIAAPKAEAFDAFLSTAGDMSVRDAAHVLSRDHAILTGEKRLRDWMLANRWLYRDTSGKPRAYQARIDQGVLAEKAMWHHHPVTGERVLDTPQVRVTARGIDRLAKALTQVTEQGEMEVAS